MSRNDFDEAKLRVFLQNDLTSPQRKCFYAFFMIASLGGLFYHFNQFVFFFLQISEDLAIFSISSYFPAF